jgi:transcriptional regulator with XRE-family HTH domain
MKMRLVEYRKKQNKTQKEMADFFEVSLDVYCSWEYLKRIPTKENMQKIIEYTKGEVTANDFYNVEV